VHLCRISSRLQWYKTLLRGLRLAKVIVKYILLRFYGPLCISQIMSVCLANAFHLPPCVREIRDTQSLVTERNISLQHAATTSAFTSGCLLLIFTPRQIYCSLVKACQSWRTKISNPRVHYPLDRIELTHCVPYKGYFGHAIRPGLELRHALISTL